MIFGSRRDFEVLTKINRELLSNVVEQEILYYKISLETTTTNIYGESTHKDYSTPVKLNCLIVRGDQVISIDDFGEDLTREVSFAFLRQDIERAEFLPEVGDIVEWHNDFFEVDTVRENELFLGRDNNYNLTDYGEKFGKSISIICDSHLTRREKTGIQPGL